MKRLVPRVQPGGFYTFSGAIRRNKDDVELLYYTSGTCLVAAVQQRKVTEHTLPLDIALVVTSRGEIGWVFVDVMRDV